MPESIPLSLGVPGEEFLSGLRASLGRTGSAPPDTPHWRLTETPEDLAEQAEAVRRRLERMRPALLDQFAETARLRGWNIHRAGDPEEAVGYIVSLAEDRGITQIARSTQDVLAVVSLDAALENLGIATVIASKDEAGSRRQAREQIVASGAGVTGADYAVAETGSVVVLPRAGLSRLVSLAPPVHVAVVRPQDVVESLDDVFLFRRLAYYRNGGDMGSYLNFITGPSRTADIEMQLVVGVHGPGEVHLVLLG